jgi:hypothetical protein
MTNFLGQMRGLAQTVQAQSGQIDGAVSGSASSLGTAGGLAGLGDSGIGVSQALAGTGSLPTAASVPPVDASGINSTLAQAAAALKAAGVPSTASAAAAAPAASAATVASAPISMAPISTSSAAALPQMSPQVLAQLAQQYAPMLQTANGRPLTESQINSLYQKYRGSLEQRLGMSLPVTLPPGAAAAAAAASAGGGQTMPSSTVQGAMQSNELQLAYQKMQSMAQQNQALKSQLAQLQANKTGGAAATSAPNAAQPAGASTGTKTALSAPLRGPMMDVPASAVEMAMSPVEPVKLELVGVQPTPLDIRLKVVIKNAQTTPLKLPSSTKAIVLMNGKQRMAKVSFPSNVVMPGGQLEGSIRVPGHDLNPSADLWLPELLPGKGAERDLHLTVPTISSL